MRAGQKLVPTAKAVELAPTVHVILAGMESLLRPSKPFDPSETSRDFAVATSEAGELMLVQPLRRRLQQLAPNVRVGWVASRVEDNIDALRNGRSHFVIDIEGVPPQAPDIRVLKLGNDTLATLARPGHRLARGAPNAASFAASGHIAVHGLPALDLVDRELAAHKLAATVTSRVSSLLSGLLLALSGDAFITVPESLAPSLEKQFGFKRVRQPFPAILFPLRLMWHSSYDRDECHAWVRAEFAKLSGERHVTG